jgi:HPt (histidine-containing phosphotransfer) domain-containing protein
MSAVSVSTLSDQDAHAAVIDEDHLARMTLGDRQLEKEVLEIFVRQSGILLDRILRREPATTAAAAHTLLGSARGIGAWRLAEAAIGLERAAGKTAENGDLDAAIGALKAAAVEATAAVGALLARPAQ